MKMLENNCIFDDHEEASKVLSKYAKNRIEWENTLDMLFKADELKKIDKKKTAFQLFCFVETAIEGE